MIVTIGGLTMRKTIIAVIFGGQSSEHEVSCMSAVNVIQSIQETQYDLLLIGITKEGRWLKVEQVSDIISGEWRNGTINAIISPDAGVHGVLLSEKGSVTAQYVDIAFPVLHGKYGEDGTIQGLLELAKIPYVGCGVLASAICMDKIYTKAIVERLGIRQANYVCVRVHELDQKEEIEKRIEQTLGYPVFIKPANSGSSCGVTKAENKEELLEGLKLAAEHDDKILVEEQIFGRELECAVLGGSEPKSSGIGEILAAAEFYDYDAKYHNEESKTVIHPQLPEGVEKQISNAAVKIFKAVDGYGLARVDFFLEKETNEVIFNEINTMPGFTGISMYPMLWEAKGLSKQHLVDKLIQLGLKRAYEGKGVK